MLRIVLVMLVVVGLPFHHVSDIQKAACSDVVVSAMLQHNHTAVTMQQREANTQCKLIHTTAFECCKI